MKSKAISNRNFYLLILLVQALLTVSVLTGQTKDTVSLVLIQNVNLFDGYKERITAGIAYELAKEHKVKFRFSADIILNPEEAKLQGHNVALLTNWYSPCEALIMVTYDNAHLLKLSGPRNPYPGDLGILKEGASSDLPLVNGNPLEDIKLMENPDQKFTMITKGGKIYKNTPSKIIYESNAFFLS